MQPGAPLSTSRFRNAGPQSAKSRFTAFSRAFPARCLPIKPSRRSRSVFTAQDQLKLGRLTLVLSGRNDWVNTADNNRLAPSESRDDSQFSGRAGLIYNTDLGIAPYVSYATSYNPIIGVNYSYRAIVLHRKPALQSEVGVKVQPTGFNGHFGASVFDLKRQNVLTTDPQQRAAAIHSDRRSHLARHRTRGGRQCYARVESDRRPSPISTSSSARTSIRP